MTGGVHPDAAAIRAGLSGRRRRIGETHHSFGSGVRKGRSGSARERRESLHWGGGSISSRVSAPNVRFFRRDKHNTRQSGCEARFIKNALRRSFRAQEKGSQESCAGRRWAPSGEVPPLWKAEWRKSHPRQGGGGF